MDQKLKAFIVVGTISMIIYTIYLMTSNGERSFLEATGNRNAANQKLMVVDQGTGEISFVKKSLEGINQNFTTEDVKIQNALKNLLGDNMKNYGGYTKTGNDDVLAKMAAADQARRTHEDEKYATKTYVNGELAKKQAKGNYQPSGNYVTYGNHTKYKFLVYEGGKNKYLAEDGCNNNLNEDMDQGVQWCRKNVPARIKIDLA